MNLNYKEIKVEWISKRGFVVLVISLTLSYLIYVLSPVTFLLLWNNVDKKNRITFLLFIGIISISNFFVGVRLTFIIGEKNFNKHLKYFLGVWYLIFGFVFLGVLIFLEKVIERKEFRYKNPEIVESYREGYVLKRKGQNYSYDRKREFLNNDSTYWFTKKLKTAMTISLSTTIGLGSFTLLVGLLFMTAKNDSIFYAIGLLITAWGSLFNGLIIFAVSSSKKKGWTSKRNKLGIVSISIMSLNFVGAYFMAISKLGYNTDDYEEVSITELSIQELESIVIA